MARYVKSVEARHPDHYQSWNNNEKKPKACRYCHGIWDFQEEEGREISA